MVDRLVQDDIRMRTELEAEERKEQMPKKIGDRIQWARERSEEYNAKIKQTSMIKSCFQIVECRLFLQIYE